jgi:phosphate transport system ATP-binding protein
MMKQIAPDVNNDSNRVESGTHPVEFRDISVIQVMKSNEVVVVASDATVTVSDEGVVAHKEMREWKWLFSEITEIDRELENSVLLQTTELRNFGLCLKAEDEEEFLGLVERRYAESLGEVPARTVVDDSVKKSRRMFSMRKEFEFEDLPLAELSAENISAWFGNHHVLDRISLTMSAGEVTALIGPSGCGKSTFLRILNRMHELVPSASLSGEVLLDGEDIYDLQKKVIDARRQVGMVFQKPNPFPAMSIYDNVVAGFRVTGTKITAAQRDEIVESSLQRAGLWKEVRDRLRQPGGGLSGGQQQRLCIARALALRPRVLLMDEPCSALDPTSTRRIEETIVDLRSDVTIVIVTHNMQQAARVSDQCAFFLAEQGTPGVIVEHGPTNAIFENPQDQRTADYVNGRFG